MYHLGYPLRILSTHNGQSCLYYKFLEQVNKGKLKWSHHKTPIHLAVDEGLIDKIYGRPTTEEERQAWLDEECKTALTIILGFKNIVVLQLMKPVHFFPTILFQPVKCPMF